MQKKIFLNYFKLLSLGVFALGVFAVIAIFYQTLYAEDKLFIDNPWASKIESPDPAPSLPRSYSYQPEALNTRIPNASATKMDMADFSSDTPKVILAGLEAYRTEGAEAAIRRWIAGGPMETDPSALSGVSTFKNIESYYGSYRGYQILNSKSLSPTAKLIYLQMNYEKGPLFTRFLCYWTNTSWVVTGRLSFNTDPAEVMEYK